MVLGWVILMGCGSDAPPHAGVGVDGGAAMKSATDLGGSPAQASCEGDFTLGQTFNHGNELGTACAPTGAPTNCIDGSWIVFPKTSECICIAACSTFKNVSLGDSCSQDGTWVCQDIKATNASGNSGQFCVPAAWKLCMSGGGGANSGGGGTSGGGGSTSGGGSCKNTGAACFDDSECCSQSCSFSKCE